ncbi:MAG: hypothetical protein KatS3mg102_2022 [Planctomycetota bacterium]|nr:MAG: hypothetical protein KatS3mg102_2022 [Planctomycetota bacterium]
MAVGRTAAGERGGGEAGQPAAGGRAGGDAPAPAGGGAAAPAQYPPEVIAFAGALSREDRTFLLVRDELYGGSWEEVEHDLRARLAGRPYIFKLATRIEEDLERIERLRRYEREHGVDLRQVLAALGLE